MKKLLFILVICLISLSSKISYSQVNNIFTFDSLIWAPPYNSADTTDLFNWFHKIEVFSTLNSVSDSIIEKGIYITTNNEWQDILLFPLPDNPDAKVTEAYVSIINEEFDTVLYFIPDYRNLYFQSYIITTIDTFYSDTIIEQYLFGFGLKEISDLSLNVKVYPTLIDKEININSDKYPISLSVIDLFGREVFSKEIYNKRAIDIDFLKKGTYIIKLKHKDTIINRKIIKK